MSFKIGHLNDGSTYQYKDYRLCDADGNGYKCGDDNILVGLSKSKHVTMNDKPVTERKLNNIFAELLNSRIHLDLEEAAPAIEKVLSKVETLGDGFTVNFLVKEAEFPEPPDLVPKIAFSVPTMIPYETDVKVSLAPARQIYEVYKKENYAKRKQSKDLVAAIHGKPWSLVTPDEYVVEQYNPLSMQKLMLSGNETQFGTDRKVLLTDYITQSGATVVVTFSASETITCMTGHVDEILLVSLLDSPAADSYERNYSRIFAKKTNSNPKKKVVVARLNLRIRDISSMNISDFLDICKYELDGREAVFVHNFSPDLVKLAAQFNFSIGYYISVEHAMILPSHIFPPQLPDAELDRMNLTYAMIERDPLVLTRSHTAIYDPSRHCVISFSEHAAYPDPVFEDRGCNLPMGVIAVDMQVCSAKIKSKTRVKVLLGVQSDNREFKLVPPEYDGSLLLRMDTRIKFVPSVVYQEMEFLSGTLVYPNQDVVYPVSGVYVYTVVNGVKLFADIKFQKLKYLERRLMLQRARMLLIPISSDPLWSFSIVLDTGQKRQLWDFGVSRDVVMNPFRLLNVRNNFKADPITEIKGFSINQDRELVLDVLGRIVISPSADFDFSRKDSRGTQVSKKYRGMDNFSFVSLTGDHRVTITVVKGKNFLLTSPNHVRYKMMTENASVDLVTLVMDNILDLDLRDMDFID